MSTKEIINCLTISFLILPCFTLQASVKDILNNWVIPLLPTHLHTQNIETQVSFFSLKEYKNDGKNKVVIDAGHGGHDPGACGEKSKEKDIALSIALKLGEKLKLSNPEIEVIYTRTKDVFIPLHKRIKKANEEKADLFISIHCNYVGNPDVCGTETFVMGLHRAEENLAVAKRENESILLESEYESHYEGYDPNSPVGHILLSMIQNVFLDHSIDLASKVEASLSKRKKTKSRGVKQAGFVVLREATMPSVLIETGFLSNTKEESYLLSKKGQIEMAKSISLGILKYFSNNEKFVSAPIAVEADQSTDESYIVQIGAFSNALQGKHVKELKMLGTLIEDYDNRLYKYAIGFYNIRSEAVKSRDYLKSQGYVDAFIKLNSKK